LGWRDLDHKRGFMNIQINIDFDGVATVNIGKEKIKKCSLSNNISNGAEKLEYGIITQYGEIEIYDFDKSIFQIINDNNIDYIKLSVYINDTLVAKLESNDFQYRFANSIFTIKANDITSNFNKIGFDGFIADPDNTALTIWNRLKNKLGLDIQVSIELTNYMAAITMPTVYVSPSDIAIYINQFLAIIEAILFQDVDGILKVVQL
jgi:hypothetical protein